MKKPIPSAVIVSNTRSLNHRHIPIAAYFQQDIAKSGIGVVRGSHILSIEAKPDYYPADAYIDIARLVAPGHPHHGAFFTIVNDDLLALWAIQQAGNKPGLDIEFCLVNAMLHSVPSIDARNHQIQLVEFLAEWAREHRAKYPDLADVLNPDDGCTDPDCPMHGTGIALEEHEKAMRATVRGDVKLALIRGHRILDYGFSINDYPGGRIKNDRLVMPNHLNHGAMIVGEFESDDNVSLGMIWEYQKTGKECPIDLELMTFKAYALARQQESLKSEFRTTLERKNDPNYPVTFYGAKD
jgi:hypothetical protein